MVGADHSGGVTALIKPAEGLDGVYGGGGRHTVNTQEADGALIDKSFYRVQVPSLAPMDVHNDKNRLINVSLFLFCRFNSNIIITM